MRPPYDAASSCSSSRRRRVRRVVQTAAATSASGAAATANASATTASQASTSSARSSARSSREPGATAPLPSSVRSSSWIVAFRASAAVAARLARSSRSCACACARCSSSRARSAERGRPLELDGQRGDPRAKPLDLAVEAVERLLEILDLDVLRDDRAERREPRDRVACAARRDAERDGRRAVGARGVLHVDDVAAEVPRDRERTLRRLGERVGVLDRERERCDVALGTAGQRAGRRLLRGGRVGGGGRRDESGAGLGGRALDRRRGRTRRPWRTAAVG